MIRRREGDRWDSVDSRSAVVRGVGNPEVQYAQLDFDAVARCLALRAQLSAPGFR